MTIERPPIQIAPSILDCDFSRLGEQIAAVESGGAEMLHLDIMDGHFVPNLSIGVPIVAACRRATRMFLDAHLMISDPLRYAPAFVDAGADSITFHVEAIERPRDAVAQLRELGVRVGVALNPGTPASAALEIIDGVDIVLVMSVWPGFGGQKYIDDCTGKIAELAAQLGPGQWLEVDGGINTETISKAVAAGANTLVAGSAIFRSGEPAQAFDALRRIAQSAAGAAASRPA